MRRSHFLTENKDPLKVHGCAKSRGENNHDVMSFGRSGNRAAFCMPTEWSVGVHRPSGHPLKEQNHAEERKAPPQAQT